MIFKKFRTCFNANDNEMELCRKVDYVYPYVIDPTSYASQVATGDKSFQSAFFITNALGVRLGNLPSYFGFASVDDLSWQEQNLHMLELKDLIIYYLQKDQDLTRALSYPGGEFLQALSHFFSFVPPNLMNDPAICYLSIPFVHKFFSKWTDFHYDHLIGLDLRKFSHWSPFVNLIKSFEKPAQLKIDFATIYSILIIEKYVPLEIFWEEKRSKVTVNGELLKMFGYLKAAQNLSAKFVPHLKDLKLFPVFYNKQQMISYQIAKNIYQAMDPTRKQGKYRPMLYTDEEPQPKIVRMSLQEIQQGLYLFAKHSKFFDISDWSIYETKKDFLRSINVLKESKEILLKHVYEQGIPSYGNPKVTYYLRSTALDLDMYDDPLMYGGTQLGGSYDVLKAVTIPEGLKQAFYNLSEVSYTIGLIELFGFLVSSFQFPYVKDYHYTKVNHDDGNEGYELEFFLNNTNFKVTLFCTEDGGYLTRHDQKILENLGYGASDLVELEAQIENLC